MAQNKKSFIAYTDWKDTFDALPDDKAGKLIKFIYAYVNDENPKTEDVLINAVFANIKNTLKRDLVKYEARGDRSRENGKLGGRPKNLEKPSGLNKNLDKPRKPDSDSVSVNDSVNVNEKKDKEHSFAKALDNYGYCLKLTSAKKEWDDMTEEEIQKAQLHIPKFRKKYEDDGKLKFLYDFSNYLKEKMYNTEIKQTVVNNEIYPAL